MHAALDPANACPVRACRLRWGRNTTADRGAAGCGAVPPAVGNAANVLWQRRSARREMSPASLPGRRRPGSLRQVVTGGPTTGATVVGVALSFAALQVVLAGLPWMLGFQSLRPIAIDWRALTFAGVTAAPVSVGTALAPITRMWRASLQPSLKGTAIATISHNRLRSTLVIMQLAVTTVLLIAGGLLANGFVRMTRLDVGFTPANILRSRWTSADRAVDGVTPSSSRNGGGAPPISRGVVPPRYRRHDAAESRFIWCRRDRDRGIVTGAKPW